MLKRISVFKKLSSREQMSVSGNSIAIILVLTAICKKTCYEGHDNKGNKMSDYLNLGLDIFDAITGFDLKGDGLTREGFHENLHS